MAPGSRRTHDSRRSIRPPARKSAKWPGRGPPISTRRLPQPRRGSLAWKKISAFDRRKVLRAAGDLMRARADEIATILTMEQGKPLVEARMETLAAADIIDWFADEGHARLWPHRSLAQRRRHPDRAERPGRSGRRLHAVEFPDQPGGAQGVRRARLRLLDPGQGGRGDPGRARRADQGFRRRRGSRRARSASSMAIRRRFPPISSRIPSSARSASPARPRSASSLRRSPACT